MEFVEAEYEENEEEQEIYLCPICDHEIENLEEGVFDPCEHVTACYVCDAGCWEVLPEELEEKWENDEETFDVQEWGEENIEADTCVSLTSYGMACGPVSSTTYYFFTE